LIGAALALVLAGASVELEAPGCDVELVEAVRSELATAGFSGAGEQLVARLHLEPAEGAIDCTVEDRVTHKTVSRRLAYDATAVRANRKLAIQVVELLHASLAEARFAAPKEPVPPAVDAFLEQREPPRESHWRADAAGGVAVLSVGAEPWVTLAGRYRLGPIEAGVRLSSVVQAWRISGAAGTADFGLADARVVATWPVQVSLLTLRPEISCGALIAWASAHTESAGYVGSAGVVTTAAPGAALNAELPLNDWLGLFARAALAVSLPAIHVQFDTTRVASLGQPMFELALGLSIR